MPGLRPGVQPRKLGSRKTGGERFRRKRRLLVSERQMRRRSCGDLLMGRCDICFAHQVAVEPVDAAMVRPTVVSEYGSVDTLDACRVCRGKVYG